jgi:hypothetical protein
MTDAPNTDPSPSAPESPATDPPAGADGAAALPCDLDAIEADLGMVEATLSSLASGNYFADSSDVSTA